MLAHTGQSPRKRERDSAAPSNEQEAPSASKRRKTSASDYPPRFWNTLSVVRLTRRALKEFDRRTEARAERGEKKTATPTTRHLLRSDARRLKECAKTGGPDLSALRGHADLRPVTVTMSQSSSQSRKRSYGSSASRSTVTGRTRSTTPYSAEFGQKLADQGVYPEGYEDQAGNIVEPENLGEIHQALRQTRPSMSPSRFDDNAFAKFKRQNRQASSEAKAMATLIPTIAGSQDARHPSVWGIPFNGLQKFDQDVSVASPDVYYGARPDQIDRYVRQDLGQYIVPSTDQSRPAAPNFFLEGKSAIGRPDVAQRQAMHNGAIGARGMFHLQNYGNATPTYDGNAYTLSSTYHPSTGTLQIYATHPQPSATQPGKTEYFTTQVSGHHMIGTSEDFRKGVAAYRNGRDLAQQQRDRFITSANAAAQRMSTETRSFSMTDSTRTSSTAVREQSNSDTSEDELAPQYETNAKRRRDRRSQGDRRT